MKGMAMIRVTYRATLAGSVCGTVMILSALLRITAPIILWANKMVARLNQMRMTTKRPSIRKDSSK